MFGAGMETGETGERWRRYRKRRRKNSCIGAAGGLGGGGVECECSMVSKQKANMRLLQCKVTNEKN